VPIVKRERRGATMPMGEMKRRERERRGLAAYG